MEQGTHKPLVVGSSPTLATMPDMGDIGIINRTYGGAGGIIKTQFFDNPLVVKDLQYIHYIRTLILSKPPSIYRLY